MTKNEHIRLVAREIAAKKGIVSPIDIMNALAKKGIQVSSSYIRMQSLKPTTKIDKIRIAGAASKATLLKTYPKTLKPANKSEWIRATAKELLATMAVVYPRDIVAALKKKRISVYSQQVSTALRGTGLGVVRGKRNATKNHERPQEFH